MQIAYIYVMAMRGRQAMSSESRRSPLATRHSFRSGLTLIELLITITIIAILAGLILGAASIAGESAREAHTRHMITRLHTLLVQQLNTYKTRRVKLNLPVETAIQNANVTASRRGQLSAEARLYATREMLLIEIPDRWSDVILANVGTPATAAPATGALAPVYLPERTELANAYLRRYRRLIGRTNTVTGSVNTAGDIRENQSAECLYMVITIACGDGEARTMFHESNIGDTDGDGAPEFLDGWGHPIRFLRWAPGFDSEIQLNTNVLTGKSAAEANGMIAADHDPFDVFRADPQAFRLIPLIYSWGRDEGSGLNTEEEYVTWRNSPNSVSYSTTFPYIRPALTPYVIGTPPAAPLVFLGSTRSGDGGLATDNIHNHLLGQK